MKLGVVFPQTEIGSDPAVVRDYAQAAESAGYDHLLVFDHVLGGTLERFDTLGRRPPYTDESPFHEVFVLFGFLGACTQKLELVTGIVILPQRQTALVAKQAAAVDVLTRGRLRLAVGIEGRFTYGIGGPAEWTKRAREWRALGATHLSVNTMGSGLSPRAHIDAILKMKPALDEARDTP